MVVLCAHAMFSGLHFFPHMMKQECKIIFFTDFLA